MGFPFQVIVALEDLITVQVDLSAAVQLGEFWLGDPFAQEVVPDQAMVVAVVVVGGERGTVAGNFSGGGLWGQ